MEDNDYKLVYLAQSGNEDAINLLYKKYKPLIVKKSNSAIFMATHHGIDINDIMQEAFMGLDEAIKNFSQEGNAKFYTFASLCIERKITNYIRKITNSKDKILNEAVTIDNSLENILDDGTNIENNLMGKDNDSYMIIKIREILTDFERKVFDMKLNSYTFEEIAKELNKNVKSIYNTFSRIKYKIKKNIEIDN